MMADLPPEFRPAQFLDKDKYEGTELDSKIRAVFPQDAEIQWVSMFNATHWSLLTRVNVSIKGVSKAFLVKEYKKGSDFNTVDLVKAEYESALALFTVSSTNVPEPVGYGTSGSGQVFYVQAFSDMKQGEFPNARELVAAVSKFHHKVSPTGKHGFHIPTFQGKIRYNTSWCDSWGEYFTRNLRQILDLEREAQGSTPEMEFLTTELLEKVVPRLLRPLESGGNRVLPVLLHGDLWDGNVGVDQSSNVVFYDAGSFYGHHEYDLGQWRAGRYVFGKKYRETYFEEFGASEPKEDAEDRNALYALRNDLVVSCCWPGTETSRQLAIVEMRRLVAKYPRGWDGHNAKK